MCSLSHRSGPLQPAHHHLHPRERCSPSGLHAGLPWDQTQTACPGPSTRPYSAGLTPTPIPASGPSTARSDQHHPMQRLLQGERSLSSCPQVAVNPTSLKVRSHWTRMCQLSTLKKIKIKVYYCRYIDSISSVQSVPLMRPFRSNLPRILWVDRCRCW